MGIWNFVKSAGKKLIPGRAEAAEGPDEEALRKELDELGLDASNVELKVEGDKVRVTGNAASQEEKEKIILAAGNVEGVAAVEEDLEGDDPVFYEVKKGDSLWKIAEEMLGSGARYNEIFEANRPMLKDPDEIYPGQNLRIPQG
jgi:nucleoid-associated protein YgaU